MGDLKSTSRLKINQGKELTKENQLEGTYRPITVERKERKKKDWIRPDGGGLAHPALTAGGSRTSLRLSDTGLTEEETEQGRLGGTADVGGEEK